MQVSVLLLLHPIKPEVYHRELSSQSSYLPFVSKHAACLIRVGRGSWCSLLLKESDR